MSHAWRVRVRRACRPLLLILGVVTPAIAQDSTAVRTAHITYLTGTTAYIDAGTQDGLREGSQVQVIRREGVVADLVVANVSPRRAACTIVRTSVALAVGDSVRFVAAPMPVAEALPSVVEQEPARRVGRQRPFGLRGRVGARVLVARSADVPGSDFTQPSFDLMLSGERIAGSAFGVTVDARARRDLRPASSATPGASATRVYQANARWTPARSGARVTVGRQFSPALATVSLFDGVAMGIDGARWSGGILGGTQPDATDYGYSSEVREYGAYAQLHNRTGSASVWSLTTGGIGSYARGQIDREFAYLQLSYVGRRLSTFVAQEVDYNRDWKAGAEATSVSPTSTFASANLRLTDGFALHAGVDNRRNVRLYRDRETPETEFDDRFRQGVWGGASASWGGHVGLTMDARSSRGGGPRSTSYTMSANVSRLTSSALGVRARTTRHSSSGIDGWLHAVAVEITPAAFLHAEASGGVRDDRNPLSAGDSPMTHSTWLGLDTDVGLARSWYLLLSGYRESGALGAQHQIYGALSYRF